MAAKNPPPPPDQAPPAELTVSDDMPTHALADFVQSHLLAALQGLHALATRQDAGAPKTLAKHRTAVQAALRYVRQQHPSEMYAADVSVDSEKAQDFASTIRRCRAAAGWTQAELAEVAGLSLNTIKHLEAAAHTPTQSTLHQLLAVKELGLEPSMLPWQHLPHTDFGTAPNCWIAPGYDPIGMFTDLLEVLSGRGGSLEQTYSYLDHKSALNWYGLSNQSRYAAAFRANMPLDAMARRILETTGSAGLDVIALGAGDGKQEVRLTQHLLDRLEQAKRMRRPDVKLYLLDISQPLLSVAYKYAADTIGHRPGVFVCAIQGNFHHLPQYTQLHYTPERAHRRRIICMVGNTIGNLDNEHRFFTHSLLGFAAGDLLLVHIQMVHAPADRPDEVKRHEPALTGGLPAAHAEWLGGPLWRYCQDVADVQFNLVLDTHCLVPGSYGIDAVATVKTHSNREKRFSVFRFKRYDSRRFAEFLHALGWELLDEAPFGAEATAPVDTLLLFRKVAEKN